MDKIIKSKSKKNKYILFGFLAAGILAFTFYRIASGKRTLTVDRATIQVKEVKEDFFEDFTIIQATVEPLTSLLVNVIEGGSVQEIFVENGAMVQANTPLARMYNPNTELGYLTQETAIIEQINNLTNARLNLRNQELTLEKELAAIEHDYIEAKQKYELDQSMYKAEILSKNEWQKTQENFRFQEQRKNIIRESLAKARQANSLQLSQMNASIATMEKSLATLRSNKKNFLVMAPATGRLSSFDAILGQTYSAGQSMGKIDVMKGYKLVSLVDEFYLSKISVGQKGRVDHKGKSMNVSVTKILPEIKNGRFQVELGFEDGQQQDLQQGLSFGVKLILSENTKLLVLPKGSFYQESLGKYVFVVNGDQADRRPVKLGRENPYYYEILEGLKPGDQVVTSSYLDYKNVERLNFK